MTTTLNNDFNQGESFLPLANTHTTSRNERRKRNLWCPRNRRHTSTIAVATGIYLCILNICYGTYYASLSHYFNDITEFSGLDASEESESARNNPYGDTFEIDDMQMEIIPGGDGDNDMSRTRNVHVAKHEIGAGMMNTRESDGKESSKSNIGGDQDNGSGDVQLVSDSDFDSKSPLRWWRGQDSNVTRRSEHPHKGAKFHNISGMIVDPSPKRLEIFSLFHSDEFLKKLALKSASIGKYSNDSSLICPKGNEYGIEGKGGHKVLQKIRTGILQSQQLEPEAGAGVGAKTGVESYQKRSRILCMVYTVHLPNDNHNNLRSQAHTWGRRCDGFIGASNYTDHSVGAIDLLHKGDETYGNMWQKVRSMWAYAYDHYRYEFEYFYICGDDTYVAVENLRAYLDGAEVKRLQNGHIDRISEKHKDQLSGWKSEDKEIPLVFGTPMRQKRCPKPSGGSGYVLNRAALELFGSKINSFMANSTDSREDLYIGGFFCKEGIFISDTHHATNGGWRFSDSATRAYYYEGRSPISPQQLKRVYGFDILKGMDSVSHDAVSFHLKDDEKRIKEAGYSIADLMYRYEAILYDTCNKN